LLLLSGMAILLALARALESPHPAFTRLEFLGLAVAAVWGAGAARTARIMVRQRKQGLTTATITGAGDQWIGGGAGWVSAVRVSFTDARGRLVLDRHSDPYRAQLVIGAVLMLTYLGITLYFAYRG
jgi:hypothetical protein